MWLSVHVSMYILSLELGVIGGLITPCPLLDAEFEFACLSG